SPCDAVRDPDARQGQRAVDPSRDGPGRDDGASHQCQGPLARRGEGEASHDGGRAARHGARRDSRSGVPGVRAGAGSALMSRRLVLSAVVGVTLLGQAVALLYEIVVAASFGTGRGADALALALGLALVIANEIGSWVPILFQPEYIEAHTIAGDTRADAFFVRTATLLVVAGAALAALLVIV